MMCSFYGDISSNSEGRLPFKEVHTFPQSGRSILLSHQEGLRALPLHLVSGWCLDVQCSQRCAEAYNLPKQAEREKTMAVRSPVIAAERPRPWLMEGLWNILIPSLSSFGAAMMTKFLVSYRTVTGWYQEKGL